MPPLQIMIKPASGACNMNCEYCFYHDVMQKRCEGALGMMSEQTLETILTKAFRYATSECTIAFQGGEPTLTGLAFFKRYVQIIKGLKPKNLKIYSAIQTNGYQLNEEWAKFFKENDFLVGISIDGNQYLHDQYRVDRRGNKTYESVMKTVAMFQKYNIDFNVLTVVTRGIARNAARVYKHFKENKLNNMQFVPFIGAFDQSDSGKSFALKPHEYGRFLISLFDLWYQDILDNKYVYIRYFENLAGVIKGHPPESCALGGACSKHYVLESDGGVYPCDFYVLPEYKIGNLVTDSFEEIEQNRNRIGFVEKSRALNPECYSCQWFQLCRGGCQRYRESSVGQTGGKDYLCKSYQQFFEYAYPKYLKLLSIPNMKGLTR